MNSKQFVGADKNEEQIVSAHLQLVRRVSRPFFLAGGDSEDLIQEGTLGLISAIRSFDESRGIPFEAYAEICIRRRIISAVRRASRIPKSFPLELQDTDLPDMSPVSDPLELILARESALETTLHLRNDLSRLETEILELYLEGMSYAEIAQRIGKETKSVDNAIQRIRQKLTKIRAGSG